MIQRCTNEKNPAWPRYGGRGITVCKRWRKFENFLADMGEAPVGLSLERIDNDGDYDPRNCKWATRREQGRNKRNNRLIFFKGRVQILAEWARHFGMSQTTLRRRLEQGRWP
jgi:hypothetical protein